MSYELVVFDLDGTLVDSLPDIASALNHALESHGYAPVGLDVVRGLVGDGVSRLVEKAQALQARKDPPPLAALVAALVGRYEARPCTETKLYPGIADTIETLRARGIGRAVLTNKPAQVARAVLEELGLGSAFGLVIGDGDGLPRKPDPRCLRAVCERLRTPLSQVVMVGDGLPDMLVAQAARVSSAAALWGYTDPGPLTALSPSHLLVRPTDVLAIV